MTASWEQTHLPIILSRYELRDIYNTDEFGSFYQQLPTKSFHLKGEQCARGKFSKVCLTGLAARNRVDEKLHMLVTGKAEAYLVSTSPKRNPGWTLRSFLIMQEGLTQSSMLRAGKLL